MTSFNVDNYFDAYVPSKRVSILGDAVVLGMDPFRPRVVNFFIDFDIDYNRYRLLVEAVGPGWHFGHSVYIDRDDVLDGEDWVWKAYPELVRAFRRREAWPVPNNIQLGES